MDLSIWQWTIAFLGAFLIGISKTGIQGLGVFAVALFALIVPPRESVGLVLPILIAADVVAVTAYHQHAVWSHLWGLLPWAGIGIGLGYLALGRINNQQASVLIGGILMVLVALRVWRWRSPSDNADGTISRAWWSVAGVGIIAGFTTMVANASGPIMILYLLAMGLPKLEFVGTAAWFFFVVNLFKVPFSWSLGLINLNSLPLDLIVAPAAVGGALFGRQVIAHINQKLFERLMLLLTLLAAVKLLFS